MPEISVSSYSVPSVITLHICASLSYPPQSMAQVLQIWAKNESISGISTIEHNTTLWLLYGTGYHKYAWSHWLSMQVYAVSGTVVIRWENPVSGIAYSTESNSICTDWPLSSWIRLQSLYAYGVGTFWPMLRAQCPHLMSHWSKPTAFSRI